MNNIIKILGIEENDLIITNVTVEGNIKYLTAETEPVTHHCPQCGCIMHSRGIRTRNVKHSVLIDGFEVVIRLRVRKWQCINEDCKYYMTEDFSFVEKHHQVSKITEYAIINAFKEISKTTALISRDFNISETEVTRIFEKYIRMSRLPLSEAICIDEVNVELPYQDKYLLVIVDFCSGDPIDLLTSRQERITGKYFSSISYEERKKVKYLISDMYKPYINYVAKYFPNAISVVDSFHVIQLIIQKLNNFLIALEKEHKAKNIQKEQELSKVEGHKVHLPESHEVYLLRKHRWVLISNMQSIEYNRKPAYDRHFGCIMTTYGYEKRFLSIHPDMSELRRLKEKYIDFNILYAGNPEKAAEELDKLIDEYLNCGYTIFNEFGKTLKEYRQPIINSFIMVKKHYASGEVKDARLSNGSMEGINRKIQDLKRNARGFSNFNHLRNRYLYAARNNPHINGTEIADGGKTK